MELVSANLYLASGVRNMVARQDFDQRGLTRAVLAQQHVDLARPEFELERIQDGLGPECLRQRMNSERRGRPRLFRAGAVRCRRHGTVVAATAGTTVTVRPLCWHRA